MTDFDRMQKVIFEITGLTPEQQNERMFESAFDFLQLMGMPYPVAQQFAQTQQFWAFYRQDVWYYLNRQFLEFWNNYGQDLGYLDWFEAYHTVSTENRWLKKRENVHESSMHIIMKHIVKKHHATV